MSDRNSVSDVYLRPQITLSAAKKIIAAALNAAKESNLSLSVAVVDAAGDLTAFERSDRASGVTIDVALAKARTAARLQAPSKLFEDFINSGLNSFLATPGVTPLQGGVPVVVDGQVIGAVGVSGASGEEDNAIATLAAAAL